MRAVDPDSVPSRLTVSARAASTRRSAIREIFDRANELEGVIRLEIGEPSFPTPAYIRAGAARAADDGFTRYTPNGGLRSLRALIAGKIERVDRYAVDADDVVVTPGAMNALFSLYLALLEPGDEVLLPTPGYPNMDEMVRLLGGVAVFYHLRPETGYLPDPAEVDALATPRTRAIFVNSPANPTGVVANEAEIPGSSCRSSWPSRHATGSGSSRTRCTTSYCSTTSSSTSRLHASTPSVS